jgi:hypothetical protein
MLTKLEVRTSSGALLVLPLDDISDGLVLENVDGLDPVKATIVTSSFAQQDGTQYHSSRRDDRNITIKLGLEPDYISTTVRDLRLRVYNYFMPKSEVKLRFYMSDGLVVEILGRVESCETSLFSKEPEMDISVVCFDPDLIDLNLVTVAGNTTSTTTSIPVTYDGTTDTGVTFTLNVNRTLTQFTIYHNAPDGSLRLMDFAAALVAGDVVKISTVSGSKGATLTRGGTNSSLLYAVSPQANWTALQHGDNHIRIYALGAAIPYTMTYMNRYGGL